MKEKAVWGEVRKGRLGGVRCDDNGAGSLCHGVVGRPHCFDMKWSPCEDGGRGSRGVHRIAGVPPKVAELQWDHEVSSPVTGSHQKAKKWR